MQNSNPTASLDYPLPANTEAERMILGVILLDNEAWQQARDLCASQFFLPSHRKIFAATQTLLEAGRGVDPLTLQEALRASSELDQVGGPAYIASLFDGVPRFSNISEYVAIVTEKARLREAINIGNSLTQAGFDPASDSETLLDRAERQIFDLKTGSGSGQRSVWIENVLDDAWTPLNVRGAVATGFCQTDRLLLGGGLLPGDLCVLAGRPSRGKSTWAKLVAGNVCDRFNTGDADWMEQRPVVLYFALEESKEALARRIVGMRAQLSWGSMQRMEFTAEEYARMRNELRRAVHWRLATYDLRRLNVEDIARECRAIRRTTGRLDLVVVDHLLLLKTARQFSNRALELGHITSELKTIAGERGIEAPFLVPTQINRVGLTEKRFGLEHLRDSGRIEEDADKVFIIQMPENGAEEAGGYTFEMTLAKQREGVVGSVDYEFDRTCGSIREMPDSMQSGFNSGRTRRQNWPPRRRAENEANAAGEGEPENNSEDW